MPFVSFGKISLESSAGLGGLQFGLDPARGGIIDHQLVLGGGGTNGQERATMTV